MELHMQDIKKQGKLKNILCTRGKGRGVWNCSWRHGVGNMKTKGGERKIRWPLRGEKATGTTTKWGKKKGRGFFRGKTEGPGDIRQGGGGVTRGKKERPFHPGEVERSKHNHLGKGRH